MEEPIMTKEVFERFANAIDDIERCGWQCKDKMQSAYIESCVKQLDTIYNEIKEELEGKEA